MKICLLEINADWRWERFITNCIIAITSATMAIKKCLGTVGLEHFMTAATMELKLLEHARRQCTAIFDETYLLETQRNMKTVLQCQNKIIYAHLCMGMYIYTGFLDGDKKYFDPGNKEVQQYVTNVVKDVVSRYAIDAIHFDDYFYPYRIANVAFNDALAYNNYNPEQLSREDWRRQNVTTFIKSLNKEIKKIKPYCKLGISPFGVWRNASVDPEGSATKGGQTCFDDLYADIRLWMEKEWIDYALPQLYWEIHHKAAAFEVLLPWWETHKYQRHMYYGLGVYRMVNGKGVWASEEELKNEIELIRKQTNKGGFSFYSLSCFDKLNPNLVNAIAQKANPSIAFVPSMPWLDQVAPDAPILKKSTEINHSKLIAWEHTNPSKEFIRYAVYRFNKNEPITIQDNEHIIAITKEKEYRDEFINDESFVYCVTALDRNWNESKASNLSW